MSETTVTGTSSGVYRVAVDGRLVGRVWISMGYEPATPWRATSLARGVGLSFETRRDAVAWIEEGLES